MAIRRRELVVTLVGAASAWPLAARTQQPERMRRVGVLMGFSESDRQGRAFVAAFRDELQKLGWVEGRNIRIDIRWAAGDTALMQRFAKELVALQPDLILSHLTPTTTALLQQTRIIPIVFALVADPIGSGFVASFARPGGQRHRFHLYRADDGRQMGGTSQGDCTAGHPDRDAVPPGNGDIC